MAVELRCPKCKAKLRLPIEPEPDSEIECPSANTCSLRGEHHPRGVRGRGEAQEEEEDDGDEKPKRPRNPRRPTKKAEGEQPKKRKKKKGKKKKTPALVIAAIVAGVTMFLVVAGVAIWFFTKKSSSQEMMTYLPDDTNVVFGFNIVHVQKYPEFYKTVQPTFANHGFKKAGDTLAKALGKDSIDDIVDYIVQGAGKSGGATVFKIKEEYDQSLLSKIPGAKEYTLNGVKYYTIPDIPQLGYPGLRVFGPTNRLVVFCSAIPEAKFKNMLEGNKDNMDNTAYVRSGALGKQTIRGTVWRFYVDVKLDNITLGDGNLFPPNTAGQTVSEDEKAFRQEWHAIYSPAKGMGIKASVGSREVRGEMLVQYADAEAASTQLKTWKEKEWIKDEEKEMPRWFKSLAQKTGAGKTAEAVVRDGLSFKSSGDLFIVRTSIETKVLQQGITGLIGHFTGQNAAGGGMPSMPGMPGAGGPMPPPGGGVPTGPPGGMRPPGMRRRFVLARR